MSKTYRVQQFAELAGVTVKALHHYDRLGLLRPQRTSAGYRLYADRDLQRLAQISALKLVGIPLKQIGPLLEGEARPLDEILQAQRQVLETKRQVLARAIEAIDEACRRHDAGEGADAEILRTVIEAIEMQNDVDVLKGYFDEESWMRWRAEHRTWPGPEWHALLREVEGALDVDPASDPAQTLVERWNALIEADIGKDHSARSAFTKAWRSWAMKPETRPDLLVGYDLDRIVRFKVNAMGAMVKRRLAASPEAAPVKPRASASRRRLFNEACALLSASPSSPEAQDLSARMEALIREEFGDDQELLDEMRAFWSRRHTWPEAALAWIASTYSKTFLAVADFLDAARVSTGRG